MFDLKRVEILAAHFEELGDYETAELLLTNVLEIRARDKNATASELISVLQKLSKLAQAQNHMESAIKYARRAFKIAQNDIGHTSIDLQDTLTFLRTMSPVA